MLELSMTTPPAASTWPNRADAERKARERVRPLWLKPIATSAAKRETLRLRLDTTLERLGRPS